jgi:hypothetical protein
VREVSFGGRSSLDMIGEYAFQSCPSWRVLRCRRRPRRLERLRSLTAQG